MLDSPEIGIDRSPQCSKGTATPLLALRAPIRIVLLQPNFATSWTSQHRSRSTSSPLWTLAGRLANLPPTHLAVAAHCGDLSLLQ